MKKLVLLVLASCSLMLSYSQGTLTGKIVDATDSSVLSLATVTVFKASDTSIITYRLSDSEGKFKVPSIPFGLECRVVISFSGYSVHRQEFKITAEASTLDIGTIYLDHEALSLDEVLIVAERPPVSVRKDTIEFNASAFKTLPNALVEDLLKKLPGVQVDRDGNITVNGKAVNRITVDGKSFFGSDPKMATRNLPSNVIDKIQVTDDKEELLLRGDDNINNVGKVINLTFKKGVKKGVFGKAYAGYGSNDRYEAGAIANTFRDTLQLSVLGYSNNLTRPGFSFSELMQTGGIERSNSVGTSSSTSIWRNGSGGTGIRINDINFGGITEYGGISTSSGLGLNLNHSPNTKQSIFGQYFFGNVKVDADQTGYSRFNDGNNWTLRNNEERTDVIINAHNFGLGAKLLPDSVTTINLGANYMVGNTNYTRAAINETLHSNYGTLSEGNTLLKRNNISKNYTHFATYNRRSKTKKGRRYTINHNLNWRLRDNGAITDSELAFKYPVVKDSLFNQLRDERIPTLSVNVNGNYNEPLTKNLSIRVDGRYTYESLENEVNTYSKSVDGKYNDLVSDLSNKFNRKSNSVSTSLGLEYRKNKLTVTPRLRYQSQKFENRLASMSNDVNQKLNTFLPELSIVYGKLNINYNKQVILPSYQYLIPVWDNANPYVIQNGNPDLLPSVQHRVHINIWDNNQKLQLNGGGWLEGSLVKNDVIQNIQMLDDGTQIIDAMNADGTRQLSGNGNVNKQSKFSQSFSMTSNLGFYAQYRESNFGYNNVMSKQKSTSLSLWGGLRLNWDDVFEWGVELFYYKQQMKNDNSTQFRSYNLTSGGISSEQVLRWPKRVIFENSIAFNRNNSLVSDELRNQWVWNAAVNFTLFKNEAGVLRFGVNDILKQVQDIGIGLYQNTVSYQKNKVMGNYFITTFTYNLRPSGTKKKVGGSSLLLF